MSLIDPRVAKQAEIIVDYSLKVKKGEKVVIIGGFESRPLIIAIYEMLIKKGASDIRVHFDSYEFVEIFYKYASETQIKYFPQIDMEEIKYVDCYIRIASPANTRYLTNIDARKIAKRTSILRPITDYRVENTRWIVTRFPTEAQAQEADMSLSEYENFVFSAINKVDWELKRKEQEKLKGIIDSTFWVHIVGEGTDLKLSIKGRKAENGDGRFNMPDGEVFTSVVENSTNGFITFTYPAIYLGKEFHNIRLEFKDGKVVKADAEKGEGELKKILDMDRGARIIGEFGIGNNFQIKKFTKDILFDEKIGGSIHLALGKGYKETGSKNESALHWDMIKDLRMGGEIWFDDKLVQKDGKWLIRL